MKKKGFALIFAMIFVLCFTSCAATISQIGDIFEQLDESFIEEETPMDEHSTDINFELESQGKIHIKSYAVVDGYNGSKWLALKFDYTNLSENDECCYNILRHINIYQDGALLDFISSVHQKDDETYIKPESSIEVVTTYILRNTKSDIEFELKYDDEVLSTYTLSMVSL